MNIKTVLNSLSRQSFLTSLLAPFHSRDVRILVAASVAINLIVLAIPLYINRIYTSVVPQQASDSLAGITLLLAAVLVLDVVLKVLRAWVVTWLAASTEHRLRMVAVRSVLGSEPNAVRTQPLKARMAQLRSPTVLRNQLEQQWLVRYVDLPFSLVYLLFLGLIGGWLMIPPLVLAPFFVLVARRAASDVVASTRAHHDLEVSRNQMVVNGLGLSPTIKTLNLEGFLIRRLEPLQESLSRRSYEKESATARLQNLSALFSQLNQLLIVSLGAWLVIQQDLSTGALAACTLLSGQVAAPLGKLFAADGQQAALEQANYDYQQLIDLPQEQNLLVGADQTPIDTTLSFLGKELLPGQLMVLVGGHPGQSTALLDAIQVAEDNPVLGLAFGKQSLSTFRKTWLRRSLARLKSSPEPFRGTLLESLTGFELNTRSSEVVALCQEHGVSSLIQALPRGYNTTIGESQDFPLSLGLRFRISVIQALLDKPSVLLLDGTFPQLTPDCLSWFLSLKIPCSRLIALQRAIPGLPSEMTCLQWNGDRLQEVAL